MTVLRSRKILSTANPKTSKPVVGENEVVEPATPSKSFVLINKSSSTSVTPSSSYPEVCDTGTVRRRSARLAGKLGIGELIEKDEVVSGKNKKVGEDYRLSECHGANVERQDLDFELRGEKSGARFSAADLVSDMEEVKKGENVAAMGSVKIRKRKFSTEAQSMSFESNEEETVPKKSMSLRSGKKVVKIEMIDDIGSRGNWYEGIGNSKGSGPSCSGNDLVNVKLETSGNEDENGLHMEKRVDRGGKGKGKVGCETLAKGGSLSVEFKSPEKVVGLDEVVKDKGSIAIEAGAMTRRRLRTEEKGKAILGVNACSPSSSSSSSDINISEVKIENVNESSVSGTNHPRANEALPVEQDRVRGTNVVVNNNAGNVHRERFRNFARRNASRFAHFSSRDDEAGSSHSVPKSENGLEDWPGPFSTAMQIIKCRKKSRASKSTCFDESETVELKWIPGKQVLPKGQKKVPSLQDLCLSVLCKNADAISSLDFVPDALKHKISWFLCDSRGMNSNFLELLVHGSPTEVRVRDCSWLTEEVCIKIFEDADVSKMMVLQFDQCGSCMPDYTLSSTLARSPNCLPALTTISVKGAYRLTDAGLRTLSSAAPSLKSIDISQCPMLTSEGICSLLNSLRSVLKELYLDNSHGVDAMLILPELLKLESLEVLSLAGIETVSDDFIRELLSVNGCRMKELVLADCTALTDLSLEVIGGTCSELRAVDLSNLCKLTDVSVRHLANGCRTIETLKVCRNTFSDEVIAAYLSVRGDSLKDLSLNNIIQVSNHTALSLAGSCRNLRSLDLSWCRNLTNEALGLIVDSCSSLELLKLFGCTQVTDAFIDGHSNPRVELIGLKMTPIIEHIDVPDYGPLRYSSVST